MDLHCHLDLYPNPIELAHKVNQLCDFTLLVTTSPKAWLETSKRMNEFQNIKVALGLHPEIAHTKANELFLLVENIKHTRYIGEIGIDGSPSYRHTLELQTKIFETIIKECDNKIISIHSRGAVKEVLNILVKYPNCGKPILHWYSGNLTELKTAINLGCRFSINLLMIKTKKGKEIIGKIPKELVLLETDGPFTSLNNNFLYPWDTKNIIPYLCEIWEVNEDVCLTQLNKNLNNLLNY